MQPAKSVLLPPLGGGLCFIVKGFPCLLFTTSYIPRLRSKIVLRPRLADRITLGMDRKLTLICAPAGFGKTSLLGEWIAQSERCVTWLSLDEGDSDPARFWAYFIAALQKLNPNIGKNALALLESAPLPPIEVVLSVLLNEISIFPDSFAHVLDDYQSIQEKSIHTSIVFFLEHLPQNMHLIIASRNDPPLPLARLRVGDQMTEIRSADLCFTGDELPYFSTISWD
jgi:LuxR family maltose regulon positive regulatory protein